VADPDVIIIDNEYSANNQVNREPTNKRLKSNNNQMSALTSTDMFYDNIRFRNPEMRSLILGQEETTTTSHVASQFARRNSEQAMTTATNCLNQRVDLYDSRLKTLESRLGLLVSEFNQMRSTSAYMTNRRTEQSTIEIQTTGNPPIGAMTLPINESVDSASASNRLQMAQNQPVRIRNREYVNLLNSHISEADETNGMATSSVNHTTESRQHADSAALLGEQQRRTANLDSLLRRVSISTRHPLLESTISPVPTSNPSTANRGFRDDWTRNRSFRPLGRGLQSQYRDLPIHNDYTSANGIESDVSRYNRLRAMIESNRNYVASADGLSKNFIERFPIINYKKPTAAKKSDSDGTASARQDDTEDEQCSICLEKYEPNDSLRVLCCLDKFHVKCIDRWLSKNRKCPCCKFDTFDYLRKADA
jgi:hypothetical protein